VADELEPLRKLRPDNRRQPDDPVDPGVLAEERSRLMSTIDQASAVYTHMPSIYPRISYHDEMAALEFLTNAFGFRERREARRDPEGEWGMLAWLEYGDGIVMIGRVESEVHQIASPADLDGRNTCMVNVAVHDIDAHYERAKAAGATIALEIEDAFYGYRRYEALDPEGHRWHFTEPLEDVRARRGEPAE